MGRHGQPVARRGPLWSRLPWEIVGWGGFACLVAAGSVIWATRSWGVALLVVAAGVLGVGAITVMTMATSPRRPRRPGDTTRPGPTDGGAP